MSEVTIFAGICGFTAVVKAEKIDKRRLKVVVTSPCEMIEKMNDDLGEVDWTREVFVKMCNSVVYRSARKHIKHAACPVPSAILKAIEVEAGLALPKDVHIKIEK